MRRSPLVVALVLALALIDIPVLAGDPEPPIFDCGDWVILDPSIRCAIVVESCEPADLCLLSDTRFATDSAGNRFNAKRSAAFDDNLGLGDPGQCGTDDLVRTTVLQWPPSRSVAAAARIAYIDERCVSADAPARRELIDNVVLFFQPHEGVLYAALSSLCRPVSSPACPGLSGTSTLFAFSGFPTLPAVLGIDDDGDGDDDDDDDDPSMFPRGEPVLRNPDVP